uniref:Odorant-binding protein n=1 Tax=Paracoccus marginatus TaxID=252483 RepID=A0AA51WDA6_9HEMI|nr:odorant-binding protein [Paracoccus marginatus]WMY18659.1 odorant binding protein [Paracoccus marginatus]
MNTFLILVVFGHAITLSLADFQSLYKQYAAECKSEHNANEEDIAILKSFEIPKNEIQSCLIDCLYTKLGVIVDGKLNDEGQRSVSKSLVGDNKEKLAKMEEIYTQCSKEVPQTGDLKCNIGKTLRTCVATRFPDAKKVFQDAKNKPTA